MMIMMMMGLNPGHLVRALLPCILTILLDVLVSWSLVFFVPMGVGSKWDNVMFVLFLSIGVESKPGQPIEKNWRSNF